MAAPRLTADSEGTGGLRITALVGALGALAAVGVNLGWGGRIGGGQGCVSDARSYCAMALGGRGDQPFSRRPLVPEVVHLLHLGSLAVRFTIVDAVAIAATVMLTGAVARRMSLALGASAKRAGAAGLAASALIAAAPYGPHLLPFAPDITDYGACALSFAWFAGLTAPQPLIRRWSPLLAVLAVGAREQALVPILALGLLSLVLRRNRRASLTAAAAAAATAIVDLRLPSTGVNWSTPRMLAQSLSSHVRSVSGAVVTVDNLVFGCGLVALGLVVNRRWIAARLRGGADTRFLLVGAMVMFTVQVALALVGGNDVSHIAAQAAPLIVALSLAACAATGRDRLALLLAVATVLVWQPLNVLTADAASYYQAFAPQGAPGHIRSAAALTVVLGAAPFAAYSVGLGLRTVLTRTAAPRLWARWR